MLRNKAEYSRPQAQAFAELLAAAGRAAGRREGRNKQHFVFLTNVLRKKDCSGEAAALGQCSKRSLASVMSTRGWSTSRLQLQDKLLVRFNYAFEAEQAGQSAVYVERSQLQNNWYCSEECVAGLPAHQPVSWCLLGVRVEAAAPRACLLTLTQLLGAPRKGQHLYYKRIPSGIDRFKTLHLALNVFAVKVTEGKCFHGTQLINSASLAAFCRDGALAARQAPPDCRDLLRAEGRCAVQCPGP